LLPPCTRECAGEILSQASAPLQSFTDTQPLLSSKHQAETHACHDQLLPRSWPLQRFISHEEPLNPASTQLIQLRSAPWGFSPPRRVAPLTTFRAYFIPVPLMGLTLRGLAPSTGVVRPFRPPRPSWSWHESLGRPGPPSGYISPEKSRSEAWGLARRILRLPPWASSPTRFLNLLRCSPSV